MAIVIRKMVPEEAEAVRELGKKTFEWFESLFVPKPKKGFVAYDDKKLVGAVIYKYFRFNNKKIGYVDFIFVDKSAHGKGVGSQLLKACTALMWQEGCDGQSAVIRSDNAGSWRMFLKEGFSRVSAFDLLKIYGWSGMLKQFAKTPLFFATGMEYYLTLKDEEVVSNKDNSPAQMLSYFLLSILSLLPLLLYGLDDAVVLIGFTLLILAVRVVFGWIGTLLTKEKWQFRLADGGIFPPLIASATGGLFIMAANWYPLTYRKGRAFKRSLGLTAWFQWLSLIVLCVVLMPLPDDSIFKIISELAKVIMLFHLVPFYPISPIGGKRIWEWNKAVFFITLVISILTIMFVG